MKVELSCADFSGGAARKGSWNLHALPLPDLERLRTASKGIRDDF